MSSILGRDMDSVVLDYFDNYELFVLRTVCKRWHEISTRHRRTRIQTYFGDGIKRRELFSTTMQRIGADGLEMLYNIREWYTGYNYYEAFILKEPADEVRLLYNKKPIAIYNDLPIGTYPLYKYPLSVRIMRQTNSKCTLYIKFKNNIQQSIEMIIFNNTTHGSMDIRNHDFDLSFMEHSSRPTLDDLWKGVYTGKLL
jgi:hypothetical protein